MSPRLPHQTHPGQSLLPVRQWVLSQRWDPQLWGAQGLRRGLGNNQKQVIQLATGI